MFNPLFFFRAVVVTGIGMARMKIMNAYSEQTITYNALFHLNKKNMSDFTLYYKYCTCITS